MFPRLLEVEISALRANFNADLSWVGITGRQLAGLNSLLNQGLSNPANRIAVVKLITGLPRLTSTKQLTLHTASVMISELKYEDDTWTLTDYGRWLIDAAEKRVEEQAAQSKEGSNTLWNAPYMPDLRPAHT